MFIVGKIDIKKFEAVTDGNVITDEVIITKDRIQHIIERRGAAFYNEYIDLFPEIISDPDYIFKDKNKNTALVTKTFIKNGVSVNLAVKLIVKGENPNLKNSIITAIKESNKRFAQRLRNNAPVYKKLDKDE